jgi:hypothetical protein
MINVTASYNRFYNSKHLCLQLSVAEVELRAAAEERDKMLNDANYNSLQNDEAVTRARQERDEAIERKKNAEVSQKYHSPEI